MSFNSRFSILKFVLNCAFCFTKAELSVFVGIILIFIFIELMQFIRFFAILCECCAISQIGGD
ncbi:MAG: hypothetical protein DWQ05_21990 [Calditrichaeota bacterium]|nr:MAG: hypothetical protein DWQ05_21990 [Calditrichota bacterium]